MSKAATMNATMPTAGKDPLAARLDIEALESVHADLEGIAEVLGVLSDRIFGAAGGCRAVGVDPGMPTAGLSWLAVRLDDVTERLGVILYGEDLPADVSPLPLGATLDAQARRGGRS